MPKQFPQFQEKVCIVTGGASGLGLELCKQLAASGASVVLADINAAGAAAAAAEIAQTGGKAKAVPTDVTNHESVRALIEGTAAEFRRIDYLFNNAGTVAAGEIRDLALADWRRVIDINLYGGIYGIHHAYPVMIRQGFGHIVNVASGYGMAPGPVNSPYVASKFGVVGMTYALAREAEAFGINVSVVCPGFIETPLMDGLKPINADAKEFKAQIPVKFVTVERAAELTLAGVVKKKDVISFPGYVSVLTFLYRFFPGLYRKMGKKQVDDFRKIRKPAPGKNDLQPT
jgi:NAD(P)-dependent dehydrogenase (short-subunit alcohol dehydrogenase family)